MKLMLEKRTVNLINTDAERLRIKNCFADDPKTQDKLNELMDCVEAQEWEKAKALLESDWWCGWDKKEECRRKEFIGSCFDMIGTPYLSVTFSYVDLVYAMTERPDIYKIIEQG